MAHSQPRPGKHSFTPSSVNPQGKPCTHRETNMWHSRHTPELRFVPWTLEQWCSNASPPCHLICPSNHPCTSACPALYLCTVHIMCTSLKPVQYLPHGHHVQLSSPVLVLLVVCYLEGHVTVTQESISICILCILKTCENKEWTLYIIHRHVHVRNCFALLKTSHQFFQTIAWMVCSLHSRRIPSSLPGMGAANGRRFVEVGVASRAPVEGL